MPSKHLALTIYTILLFHIPSIVLVYFFTLYFSYKAPKNEASKTFVSIMASLLLWMIAKILKTLSPTLSWRWFFVVIQYVGVYALGFLLIRFAFLYTKNRLPSKHFTRVTFFLCFASFLIVLTNPLHMQFYAYFDLYRDRFGPLFIPTQMIQYAIIIYAAGLLVLGYKQNSVTYKQKIVGWLLSFFTIAPLLGNIYYVLFKLIDLPWILPFAVFDFTPISISASLIFFIIPALKMRFLDLRSFANYHIYNDLLQGIISFTDHMEIQTYNQFCAMRFPSIKQASSFKVFLDDINPELSQRFLSPHLKSKSQLNDENQVTYQEQTYSFQIIIHPKELNHCFIYDISMLTKNKKELEQKSHTLNMIHEHLQSHSKAKLNIALSDLKSSFAQDLHDIIGHSLTVILASKKSLLGHQQTDSIKSELRLLRNLLYSSIQSIQKNAILPQTMEKINSLENLFNTLQNPNININFISKGEIIPLSASTKNTLFRIAQESVTNAIKHGKAKNVVIVAYFNSDHMNLIIHDDGIGAKTITPKMGLKGIQNKISGINGTVSFVSDGKSGFITNLKIPI